ncbi:MAG: hypothetical protein ACTSQU_14615 [Promethearchaeota archaeon]
MSWKDKIKKDKPEKKTKYSLTIGYLLSILICFIVEIILWVTSLISYQSLLSWIGLTTSVIIILMVSDMKKRASQNQ